MRFLPSAAALLMLLAPFQPTHASEDDGSIQHSPVAIALPLVVVNRNASCGCCLKWVAHLREAGFKVDVNDVQDMQAVKSRAGVPDTMRSCHTAEVGGYFVEGHVPADDIKRLLAERPDAKGLAVPGMPLGSPGMEVPDGTIIPYDVILVGDDGNRVHASHGKAEIL